MTLSRSKNRESNIINRIMQINELAEECCVFVRNTESLKSVKEDLLNSLRLVKINNNAAMAIFHNEITAKEPFLSEDT